MEDVSDGKVVAERSQDKNNGSQQHCGEGGDSGAAGGLTETSRRGILAE